MRRARGALPGGPVRCVMFNIRKLTFSFSSPRRSTSGKCDFCDCNSSGGRFVGFTRLVVRRFRRRGPKFRGIYRKLLRILLMCVSEGRGLSIVSRSSFRLSGRYTLTGQCVSAGCSRGVALSLLTRVARVGGFCLTRSFARYVNRSPVGCLTSQEVRTYGRLLAASSLSMARVTSDTNFSSRSCFSRVFGGGIKVSPERCHGLCSRMGERWCVCAGGKLTRTDPFF